MAESKNKKIKKPKPKVPAKKKKKTIIKKVAVKKRAVKKTVKKKIIKKRGIKSGKKKVAGVQLKRSSSNPIIEPREFFWESKATFNPSAFYADGKVHLVYRAIGGDDSSVLGYAASSDGHNIDERPPYYIFRRDNNFNRTDHTMSPIDYVSGGGWNGGCEDPRLTLIDGIVYMIYTAFDGWGSVRIALTSIKLEDFQNKKWNWKKPVLISPPGQIHKNWVIFPEKIEKDGKKKYAILHGISPKVMIDYFDNMDELDGTHYVYSVHQDSPLWQMRDKLIRGVGPAPIKTKYGWLVLYHKMDKHETHRYKLWAMILDSKDPTKILYNSNEAILEPDEWYENEGYKSGVVYSCGAVVKDGELFVYYGAADKVGAVATANLDEFLKELMKSSTVKLKSHKLKAR
jgi:predicted GH43/DUF377 family glycosyl hydrolase